MSLGAYGVGIDVEAGHGLDRDILPLVQEREEYVFCADIPVVAFFRFFPRCKEYLLGLLREFD